MLRKYSQEASTFCGTAAVRLPVIMAIKVGRTESVAGSGSGEGAPPEFAVLQLQRLPDGTFRLV